MASTFEALLLANTQFLLNPPVMACLQVATQSIATGSTGAAITFTSNVVDTYVGHSVTTNTSRYVFQVPGWYYVIGNVFFAANATGSRKTWIAYGGTAINGSVTQAQASTTGGDGTSLTATALVQALANGDYVETWGSQDSGGSLSTVTSAPNQSSMSVLWAHQ